jgi:biotin synthase
MSTPQTARAPRETSLTVTEVEALLATPLLDLVYRAATVHRAHHDPRYVQCSQLLSVKTGGCPEDCGYCSQSAFSKTQVERESLMSVDKVLAEAREANRAAPIASAWARRGAKCATTPSSSA